MFALFGKLISNVEGKTYIGGLGLFCAAYLKYKEGDINGAFVLASEGLGVIGIGNKIEKQKAE